MKNEVSNKYGKLKVIERVENNKSGTARWLCRCDCGAEKIVRGTNLRNGHTKSCGCVKKELGISRYFLLHTSAKNEF